MESHGESLRIPHVRLVVPRVIHGNDPKAEAGPEGNVPTVIPPRPIEASPQHAGAADQIMRHTRAQDGTLPGAPFLLDGQLADGPHLQVRSRAQRPGEDLFNPGTQGQFLVKFLF